MGWTIGILMVVCITLISFNGYHYQQQLKIEQKIHAIERQAHLMDSFLNNRPFNYTDAPKIGKQCMQDFKAVYDEIKGLVEKAKKLFKKE